MIVTKSSIIFNHFLRNSRYLSGLGHESCRLCNELRVKPRRTSTSPKTPLLQSCKLRQYHISASKQHSNEITSTWHDLRAQSKGCVTPELAVLQLDEVVDLIREEGGVDVVVIQVPEEMCYVDYFMIATANSPRHLFSISEILNKLYKKKRKHFHPFVNIEGKKHSDDWHSIDFGNMVIHIMLEKTRSMYNLEKLWLLGPDYDDELHRVPTSEEVLEQMTMQGLNLMSMNEDTVKALGNIPIDSPWLDDADDSLQEAKDDKLEDDDAFLV